MAPLRAVYLAFNQLESFGHRVRCVPCADFATMLIVPHSLRAQDRDAGSPPKKA